MYMYDISILVPGIRTTNWQRLYDSAAFACGDKTYEMIFVGPHAPDITLAGMNNVKYIEDYGSPNRCQQIAAINSAGKYLMWATDDGVLYPDTLGKTMNFLESLDEKNAACMKFIEGDWPSNPPHLVDDYYYVNSTHWTRSPYISNDQLIMNTGLVHEKLFREIGGFDATLFETTAMAHSDFAVRLTHYGVKIHLVNDVSMHVSFTPGESGDHGPVHEAHHYFDIPQFKSMYANPASLNRCKIDLDNWKNTPNRWARRFGSK